MNIQHNLSALKLNNNLAASNKLTAKSMEKLATGLRINLGADEAAAESRIRDTDMAKEIISLTKKSILAETTQAVLAQGNRQSQQVLELLK